MMASPQTQRWNPTLVFLACILWLLPKVELHTTCGMVQPDIHSGEDSMTLLGAYKQSPNPAGLIFYEPGTADLPETAGVWLTA